MNIMSYATRDVVTVKPADSIDTAISLMEERNIHHLVVVADNRVVGMLSDRDILVSTGWMLSVERKFQRSEGATMRVVGPSQVQQIMSHPAISLSPAQSVRDAALLMLNRKISSIPVVQEDRLVGLVCDTDLIQWLDELAPYEGGAHHILNRKVQEAMRANVVTAAPDAPLSEVVHLLRNRRIRHVPVVVKGKPVGIVSDRDVRRALGWASIRDMQAEGEGHLFEDRSAQTASDVMKTALKSVRLLTPLKDALRLMLDSRIHSLLVVESDCLKGILTHTDLITAIMREDVL